MRWILGLFFLGTVQTFAYSAKEGNVTASLGPFFHKTRFESSSAGANSPYLGGESLIVNGDINSVGAIEFGIFHMNKIFFREQGPNLLSEMTEMMHVTMGYRRYLNPALSTSLSFFSSYSMGDVTVVHNDFTSANQIDSSARDITEYGFDWAVQTELYSHGTFAVILDGRYSLSLTSKPNEKSDHYGVILGVRFLAQEKPAAKP